MSTQRVHDLVSDAFALSHGFCKPANPDYLGMEPNDANAENSGQAGIAASGIGARNPAFLIRCAGQCPSARLSRDQIAFFHGVACRPHPGCGGQHMAGDPHRAG